MKRLFLLPIILAFGSSAFATTCAGELNSGKFVTLDVITWGTLGAFGRSEVTVYDDQGFKLYGYEIERDEVLQFGEDFTFEGTKSNPTLGTIVLSVGTAFNQASLTYRGLNYLPYTEDKTIFGILRDPKRRKQSGNHMRVWKGPGYNESEAYEFKDVICVFEQDV